MAVQAAQRNRFSSKHNILIRNTDGTCLPMDKPYYDAREVVPGVWQIMSSGDFLIVSQEEKELLP